MIQDIYPHQFDNQFRSGQTALDQDPVFVFSSDRILCRGGADGVSFPEARQCERRADLIYFFALDGQRFFLGEMPQLREPDAFEQIPLRSLRRKDASDRHLIFAAVTAYHLYHWYSTVRYRGRCGTPLRHAQQERAMVCSSCGQIYYPRINPAVIVGVTHGDQLLLTKYAGRGMHFYALVAGFTEIGESFEETVRREVMEETGLSVGNIRMLIMGWYDLTTTSMHARTAYSSGMSLSDQED